MKITLYTMEAITGKNNNFLKCSSFLEYTSCRRHLLKTSNLHTKPATKCTTLSTIHTLIPTGTSTTQTAAGRRSVTATIIPSPRPKISNGRVLKIYNLRGGGDNVLRISALALNLGQGVTDSHKLGCN